MVPIKVCSLIVFRIHKESVGRGRRFQCSSGGIGQ